jgi:CBS domain-containing protein
MDVPIFNTSACATFIYSREVKEVITSLIKEFMTNQVLTIDINDTVLKAAEAMTQDPNADGYAVVLKQGRPTRIVT